MREAEAALFEVQATLRAAMAVAARPSRRDAAS
jgi:hypothetical protein